MARKKDPMAINKREKAILKFIEKQIMTDGYPPSVREIGKAVGLSSTATVHGYLARLDEKGYIKKQNNANNGEIVVALIEDEATVKTFYKENGHIRLQPENHTMDPIIVPDCKILGKVAGVFRKM